MWIIRPWRERLARRPAGRPGGPGCEPSRAHRGFGADRSAVTSLEYALLGAFVMGAIVAAVSGYSGGLGALMVNSFAAVTASM